MTEDGLKWHEQAAVMEAALMETQDPAKLIYDQDNGKTDAYAGVSINISDFVRLASQALEQAKNGENVGGQEPDKGKRQRHRRGIRGHGFLQGGGESR